MLSGVNIKKLTLKILILIIGLGIVIGISYYLMNKLDFYRIREELGDSLIFWLIIVLLQVIQVIFIPISNQIITIPMTLTFPNQLWKVFLSSWIGIVLGTIGLYFIGRYGGEKILGWILSDKKKSKEICDNMNRTKYFYPIGMLIPIIPDDILSTIAGMSKYNFLYVLIVSIISRGMCTATSVFSIGLLPLKESVCGLFILISLIIIIYKEIFKK